MGIGLRRFGSHGVNLVILRGRIDRDALIGFWRGIDPEDPANTTPWILYLSRDADMSEIDIAAYAELKRIIAPIRDSAAGKKSYTCVMVSNSERCDSMIKFWKDVVKKDSKHPPYAILFSDVKGACESLNLPGSAEEAIADAIRAHRVAHEADEGGRFSADRP